MHQLEKGKGNIRKGRRNIVGEGNIGREGEILKGEGKYKKGKGNIGRGRET